MAITRAQALHMGLPARRHAIWERICELIAEDVNAGDAFNQAFEEAKAQCLEGADLVDESKEQPSGGGL